VLSRYASWVTIIMVAPLVIVVAIVVSMADVVSQGLGLVALVGVAGILLDVGPNGEPLSVLDRVSYALAIVSLACGLIAVQVVGQNALALMFPAWVRIGPARPGGVEAMGQRMVLMAISFLVLMIALIPAAIAAALVGFALSLVMSGPPVVLPSVVALGVLIVECWLVTTFLGQVLERTDLSAVDAAE